MITVNDGAGRRTNEVKALADKSKIPNEGICVLPRAQLYWLPGQTLDADVGLLDQL